MAQIDHLSYPNIFDNILDHVTAANDLGAMRVLRGTCTALAAVFNPRLQRHVIFSLTNTHIALLSRGGGRVLFQPRNQVSRSEVSGPTHSLNGTLHQIALAHAHQPTMNVLGNIQTIDFRNTDYSPAKTHDLHTLLFTIGAPPRTARILSPHVSARYLLGGDYPKVVTFVNFSHARRIPDSLEPLAIVPGAITAVVNIRVDINLPFHGGISLPFVGHNLTNIVLVFDVASPASVVSEAQEKDLLVALDKLFEAIRSYIHIARPRNSRNQSPLFTFVDLHKALWQARPGNMLGDVMQPGAYVRLVLLKGFQLPTHYENSPAWVAELQNRMDNAVRFMTSEQYKVEVGEEAFYVDTVK